MISASLTSILPSFIEKSTLFFGGLPILVLLGRIYFFKLDFTFAIDQKSVID